MPTCPHTTGEESRRLRGAAEAIACPLLQGASYESATFVVALRQRQDVSTTGQGPEPALVRQLHRCQGRRNQRPTIGGTIACLPICFRETLT
jgi:hypothetical protein